MPNLEEHCKHCLDLFGYEGREVHKWLDEPSRYYGGSHRVLRHDRDTAIMIGKMFGKYYGEGIEGQIIAQGIFFAHIFLDIEASKKKGLEPHQFTPEQLQELEEEKPKYKQEMERVQKQIKELSELPEISTREMREYLDIKLGHKSVESRLLAEVSLRHWQHYLLTRNVPNRKLDDLDITGFVSQLNKKVNSPYTKANYLFQLVLYFRYAYGAELAVLLSKEKGKADKEIKELKKNALPLRIKVVKRFYRETKPHVRIAIRLLLLEDIQIDDLVKITAMQDSNGNYHFFNNGRTEIDIDSDTAKLAVPLLHRNKGKLIKGGRRSLHALFQSWSEKLHFEPNITPMNLRIFGKNHHPDDIRDFILD